MQLYLKSFDLPSEHQEIEYIKDIKETCYLNFYPFQILTFKLNHVEFAPVTIFYGNNGSGKSTLLNIIAEKIRANRNSPFNGSALFNDFTRMCTANFSNYMPNSMQILTGDDVSEKIINLRYLNDGIDTNRREIFDEYASKRQIKPGEWNLDSLDDYESWKEILESKTTSKSSYVRNRLHPNRQMYSNGETTIRYFMDKITDNGLYLLDEPENSVSLPNQIQIMEYLQQSARFFNCQFIIATHSPVFLSMPNAKIYNLDNEPATINKWTELENVKILFDFFMKHKDEF